MASIFFNTVAIVRNRNGAAQKEPLPGAKPIKDTNPPLYEDDDVRDAVHADVALLALDAALESDNKTMQADPAKWVKAVLRREDIAATITSAQGEDGWAELAEDDRDLLMERLAELAVRMTNANVGPVLRSLRDAPKKRPEPVRLPRQTNGESKDDDHPSP